MSDAPLLSADGTMLSIKAACRLVGVAHQFQADRLRDIGATVNIKKVRDRLGKVRLAACTDLETGLLALAESLLEPFYKRPRGHTTKNIEVRRKRVHELCKKVAVQTGAL